jgi:hypothetical protein
MTATLGPAVPAALADGFAPHRAVYSMTLVSARGGSGITAASGRMAVQWQHDCQGWTFDHRSVLDLAMAEGDPVRVATHASSWESEDSRQYSFTLRNLTNDKETDRVEGMARIGGDGAGTVTFTQPEPRDLPLPKGTLFPVAHSKVVLDAGAGLKRSRTISRLVFDGMGEEGAFQVNAVLTPARDRPDAGKAAARLAGLATFNATIAYFETGAAEAEPKHEMAMRMFANGVADDLVIDFEQFTVRAVLEQVDMLPVPDCGRR